MNIRSKLPLLLLLALAIIVLAACGPSASEPTATPTPEVPTVPPVEDAWNRIQASGTLKVATSADYPPFEYYDQNFRLDGFDIALIRAIGEELGLTVEIKDFAFDGLAGAIELGQADVAIAAISFTPERAQAYDFSNIYLVTESGLLVRSGAGLGPFETARDLVGLNLGVQRGSIYDDWVQENLINPGIVEENRVFVYQDVERAVNDLRQGRLDMVILDAPVGKAEAAQGGLELISEGLYRQRLAIGLQKGQDTLRGKINEALDTLQEGDVIHRLAKQYLDLEPEEIIPPPEVLPTPVPPPANATPTPVPPPAACIDGMAWVADLSYDDSQGVPIVPGGSNFRKGWRVRNTGTCTWNSAYYLAYVRGNTDQSQMGGQPVYVQGTVAPGQTYDFYVDLVAPTRPGEYQGFWQMHNGRATKFGETIWVAIRVPTAPTPPPAATATPNPSISFTVDRTNIRQGECVTFRWNVQNVQAVYFYAEGENWQDRGVAGQGSQQECPQQTTTYYLRVVQRNGNLVTQSIIVYVEPVANAPVIQRFELQPPGQVAVGQCLTILWEVAGNANRIVLSRNNATIWDGAPLRGTMQDCPPGTGTMEYRIEAAGPGGTARQVEYVNVYSNTPTPVPPTNTPVPPTNTPVPPTNTPAPQPTDTPVPQSPVVGNWNLVRIYDGAALEGVPVTANFGADGSLNGTGGCNTFNGTYFTNGSSIAITVTTFTQALCDQPIMDQETTYFDALNQARSWIIEGGRLKLFDGLGTQLLSYVPG